MGGARDVHAHGDFPCRISRISIHCQGSKHERSSDNPHLVTALQVCDGRGWWAYIWIGCRGFLGAL